MRVCLVTSTFIDNAGQVLTAKLISVLRSLCEKLYVITGMLGNEFGGDNTTLISLKGHEDRRISIKIIKFLISQLRICRNVLAVHNHISTVILYINSGGLTLPLILSKILGKKVVLIVSASDSMMASLIYRDYLFGLGGKVIALIYRCLEKINWQFSDKIIVDSEKIAEKFGIPSSRVAIASDRRFVNVDKFQIIKSLEERKNLVGYIGRLSYEKGVMNFLKAISLTLEKCDDVEFLIAGDGPLKTRIDDELAEKGLGNVVDSTGWIPHRELADWLNKLRILVVPSYTESLPNIVLEAMACGAPVLVTNVGALPEIIKDEETGFIMDDNSAECIAQNILRGLEFPRLGEIVSNGRKLVVERYNYETAVKRLKAILESVADR